MSREVNEEEDFDRLLKSENAEFLKDEEIVRILRAFKLDAYAVLDILPGCTTKDIRNTFRRKSLLIHPDKTTNPKAPGIAFLPLSFCFLICHRGIRQVEESRERAHGRYDQRAHR